MEKTSEILWSDRKRPIFGLPLSFTKYTLFEDKLYVTVKFLSMHEEEIRLYRITDITLKRTLFDRIFGVGTILCHSSDTTTPTLEIRKVKNAENVRTMLSELIEKSRKANNVTTGEFVNSDGFFG